MEAQGIMQRDALATSREIERAYQAKLWICGKRVDILGDPRRCRMRSIALVILSVALMCSVPASAQRRPTGSQEKRVGVAIDLKVNGAPYTFKGEASCDHLARGSIYDIVAERWSVQQNDADRSLSFSLWRPTSGAGDMVTLNVSMGGKRYDVSTVKSPQGPSGSGSVKLAPESAGGTFTIDATTASAAKITGTVKCNAFTASETVAGN
jgi:hypothetical protein